MAPARHREGVVASLGRPALVAAALAAAIGTAGISAIPFYTRGEPREALVVREMYAGNGWVLPLRNGTTLPRKPPLFHWLGAGASLAAGRVDEATVRLPSAAASVAAAVLVGIWAGGGATGLLVALVTITSFEWMRASTVARVDMVYSAWLALALLALDRLVRGPGRVTAWGLALWLAVTGATLTKGPIAIVLVSLAVFGIAVVRRRTGVLARVRPLRGLVFVGTVAGAWFALAVARHGEAFVTMVAHENLHHLFASATAGAGHPHGVGYLLGMGGLGFLPWTPLLVLAATLPREEWRDAGVQLAGVWAATVICVHALASSKRGVYLLPAYPAIALLLVRGALRATDASAGRTLSAVAVAYAALATAFAAILATLAWGGIPGPIRDLLRARDRAGLEVAVEAAGAHALLLTAAAALILIVGPFLLRAARARRFGDLAVAIAMVSAGCALVFNNLLHPPIASARSLRSFMAEVGRVVGPQDRLYFVGTADHGAAFYAGRWLSTLSPSSPPPAGAYLLLWERDWAGRAAAGEMPQPVKVSGATFPGRGHLVLVAVPGGAQGRPPPGPTGGRPD
jgi:4-amino-4-deoxy-L-arabinose transferase-like glycosyltransferase